MMLAVLAIAATAPRPGIHIHSLLSLNRPCSGQPPDARCSLRSVNCWVPVLLLLPRQLSYLLFM